MLLNQDYFTLTNFEGPLDFLLCLIQREEIDIYDVPIQTLIQQFIDKLLAENVQQLDRGAEFIGTAAYLVWLKSKTLLPREEAAEGTEEAVEDPHFEIIHHLIDYCRFKQSAKALHTRQEQQQALYFRGESTPIWKKPLGIDHISLDELAVLFKDMLQRAAQIPPQIQEEQWRVSDKIRFIRQQLKLENSFPLEELFPSSKGRLEWIVTFLALLELMKIGELIVGHLSGSPESIRVIAQEVKDQL